MNPEELILAKKVFEEAKVLAKEEKVAGEIEKAMASGDFDNTRKVIDTHNLTGGKESKIKIAQEVPTKLVEDKNIYRGSSKEYSLAKKDLNEYESGEIYKINKMNIPKSEQNKLIRRLQSRNKAYIEGNIGTLNFNKSNIRQSAEKYRGKKIFEPYRVDKE